MAPTLTSNSFLLTTTPRSRLALKSPRFVVFSKGSGPFQSFRLGKQDDGTSEDGSEGESSKPSGGFSFDIGKFNSNVQSLIPVVRQPSSGLSFGGSKRKDAGTVFVAGATGQAGIRIAQTLLRKGFTVRAAVPDLGAAQELARLAAAYKIISAGDLKRLNAVGSTFNDPESIAKAISNAAKVVVTVGPAEDGPASAVTLEDALLVVQASQLAGVDHVAIIYDGTSGTSKSSNVLYGISSFFNNLFAQTQPLTVTEFLDKLVETDVKYTMVKTRLTEDYSLEGSYNVIISNEGTSSTGSKNDYKVATSQIASLVADVFSNTAVTENKVVEVSTDPSAPLKPIDQLFSVIPEDGRRKAYKDAIAKAQAEEEAIKASERAREAAEAAKKLEEEVKKLSETEARAATKLKEESKKLSQTEARAANLAKEAQEKAKVAGISMEKLMNRAKGISSGLSWESLSSQIATAVQNKGGDDEKPKVQIATVRGQAKARTLPPQKAVVKQSKPKPPTSVPKKEPKPKPESKEVKKEERKIFGGLFKQETIYMDD